MLTVRPDAIPQLQAKLAELEKSQAARGELTPLIEQANGAIRRLQGQAGDAAKQRADHDASTPHNDPKRLSQLLAGDDVPPIDKVAEARVAKFQGFDAQGTQYRRDLDIVTRHLTQLQAQAAAADRVVAAVYTEFLDALGNAVVEVYQQFARDFVSTFMPALYSINLRHRQVTAGVNAPWFGRIVPSGLTVLWTEPGPEIIDGPGMRPRYPVTSLWPRNDLKLITGEPVESDAAIDGLMETIRNAPAPQTSPGM